MQFYHFMIATFDNYLAKSFLKITFCFSRSREDEIIFFLFSIHWCRGMNDIQMRLRFHVMCLRRVYMYIKYDNNFSISNNEKPIESTPVGLDI